MLLRGGVVVIAIPLTASVGALSRRTENAQDLKPVWPFHSSAPRADIGTSHTEIFPAGCMGALRFMPAVRRSRGLLTLIPGSDCRTLQPP